MISTLSRWARAHPLDLLVYVTLAFLASVYGYQDTVLCAL